MEVQDKPRLKGKHETVQVFKNPILEILTKTHIAFPLTILPAFSGVVLYLGYSKMGLSMEDIGLYFFLSFFAFTFIEYWVHRKVFHMVPNSKIKASIQYGLHGVHHEQPKDKKRLAMPIVMSFTLAFVVLGLFYLMMGNHAFATTPGFVMGYCGYLSVHYIVHAFKPPRNAFKTLWVHHAIHHYKDDTVAFGVSSPFWDVVFRTMPPRKAA